MCVLLVSLICLVTPSSLFCFLIFGQIDCMCAWGTPVFPMFGDDATDSCDLACVLILWSRHADDCVFVLRACLIGSRVLVQVCPAGAHVVCVLCACLVGCRVLVRVCPSGVRVLCVVQPCLSSSRFFAYVCPDGDRFACALRVCFASSHVLLRVYRSSECVFYIYAQYKIPITLWKRVHVSHLFVPCTLTFDYSVFCRSMSLMNHSSFLFRYLSYSLCIFYAYVCQPLRLGGSFVHCHFTAAATYDGRHNNTYGQFTFCFPSSLNPTHESTYFPPKPISQSRVNDVITCWTTECHPDNFEEGGCSVCGQLTPLVHLSPLKHMKNYLGVLNISSVTRKIRLSESDPIQDCEGPVLDHSCRDRVCDTCRAALRNGKIPNLALAHGLWLGEVPDELKNLSFYEKMLVARVRHNKCFVHVQKGAPSMNCKLISNVIAFENPTLKIYDILPPPREDFDEVLAIMFSGPCKPTDEDYKRALLLIRRNVVASAIKWLILNNPNYSDVSFSAENLECYSEEVPIVSVEFFEKGSAKNAEGVSVNDDLDDYDLESGECVFTVHGITGDALQSMTMEQLKGQAAIHLDNGCKFMRTSHAMNPESLWNNPQLYPKMFPWLFPFQSGGYRMHYVFTQLFI